MIEEFKKIKLIIEYIDEEECVHIHKTGLFNCDDCKNLEECFINVKNTYYDKLNYNFVESIGYGGYESSDEF